MVPNKLDRRTFMQHAGALGMGLMLPWGAARATEAVTGATPYGGPYWIMVHAGGGWDPLFSFDPKPDVNLNRLSQDVAQVGNISYSPIPISPAAFNFDPTNPQYAQYLLSAETFLQRRGGRTLVLNGIDTQTNNHDSGTRNTWSGQNDGYPALGALIAGTYGAGQPLAFISSGGYDATLDQVALSRISGSGQIATIAQPNLTNPNDPNSYYQLPSAFDRISQFQAARLGRLLKKSTRAREQASLGALLLARSGASELANVKFASNAPNMPGGLGDLQGFCQQTDLVLSAFGSGVGVAASMSIGGFDTHGNHDTNQLLQLSKLLSGIDYLLGQLDATGLASKTYVLVGSEFGRGPQYNGTGSGSGKDHWPVTTMLAYGPNVPGNKVIGASNSQQQPLTLNTSSLQPDASGVSMTPTLINKALRQLAGVTGKPGDTEYPLLGVDLPLFG